MGNVVVDCALTLRLPIFSAVCGRAAWHNEKGEENLQNPGQDKSVPCRRQGDISLGDCLVEPIRSMHSHEHDDMMHFVEQ